MSLRNLNEKGRGPKMGFEKGQVVRVTGGFYDSSSGQDVAAGSIGRVWKIEGDSVWLEVEVESWLSKKSVIVKTDKWNIS